MRLPGTPHACGPLLELGWLSRQLHLGAPIPEGTETIAVEQVVGTVQRGRDFDSCWHPLHPRLKKLIDDMERAAPAGLDEPIEVVRVDRAYFVTDGHKRIALAHRTGREFIDASISRVPTPYAVTGDLDEQSVLRTAREGEFRRHSGLEEALPDVRFVLTEIDAYGELYEAVRTHAFLMAEAAKEIVPWPDVARDWYASDYLPVVEATRSAVGGYIESCSDADVYLSIHRQRLAWWGSECDAIECAAQQLLAERQIDAARRRPILDGLLARTQAPAPVVLPLTRPRHDD
jgi:hypothetical protein